MAAFAVIVRAAPETPGIKAITENTALCLTASYIFLILSQIIPADIPLSAVKAVKTILFSDSKQAPLRMPVFLLQNKKNQNL